MEDNPEAIAKIKREFPGLMLRVRDGIDKITAAYLKVHDITDEQIYLASMRKIDKAVDDLDFLAYQLRIWWQIVEGQTDCLYVMNKKKTRPCVRTEKTPRGDEVEILCWVCTSSRHYWEEEWSEFTKAMLF